MRNWIITGTGVALMAIAGVGAYVALPANAAPAVPACVSEDGPGPCFWDASTRGNGIGRSFWLDANQTIHYVS